MSRIKSKEKGAILDRQEENAPSDEASSAISILPQKSLENQGNEDVMSENVMENTDVAILEEDDSGSVGGTGYDGGTEQEEYIEYDYDQIPEEEPPENLQQVTATTVAQAISTKTYKDNVRSIILSIVDEYIKNNGPFTVHDLLTNGAAISDDCLTEIQKELSTQNEKRKNSREKAYVIPTYLPPSAVIRFIMSTGAVRALKMGMGGCHYRIIVKHYNPDGSFSGIWELIPELNKQNDYGNLNSLVNELIGPDAPVSTINQTVNAIRSEMTNESKNKGYIVEPGWDPDLVPFYNGVFNGRERTFMEYTDPAYEATYGQYIWMNKMDTSFKWNAVPLADFDPIAFIRSLFDDSPEGEASFKIVLIFGQFMLRRYPGLEGYLMNFINKSGTADGKNGKTSLADMMLGIIEHGTVSSYNFRKDRKIFFQNGKKVERLAIDKWGKDFELASNIMCAFILASDETSGKKPVEETGFLKNNSRHQVISLRPMFHPSFTYIFNGTLLHLQNEETMLGTKDGASFTHRIDLAFEKDFSKEKGDPRIKTYYTVCEETWEYLAYYLMTQVEWYEDYSKELLKLVEHNTTDVMEANIPAFTFFNEVMDGLRECAVVPTPVLYELYRNWVADNGWNRSRARRAREPLTVTEIKVQNKKQGAGATEDVLPPSCLPFSCPAISINYLCSDVE